MRKNIMLLMFALLAAVSVLAMGCGSDTDTASEEGGTELPVDGGYLLFDKATGTITGYEGDLIEVGIPAATFDGDRITSIGEGAFRHCSSLTSVEIPDSITTIGKSAFESCSGLTSVTIPNSVTTVGDSAFKWCSGLASVKIPDSVTTIGNNAFAACSALTSVEIPGSVATIGKSVFSNCSGLISIAVDVDNQKYSSQNGVFFDKAKEQLIQYPIGNERVSYEIPDGVKTIGKHAFVECRSLTSVEIPDSVTTIGEYAFAECRGLTSVGIPDSVTTIEDSAFYGCRNLANIGIPDSVTTIEHAAFYGCRRLTSVTIPSSVTTIGKNAFGNCSRLESIAVDVGNQKYSSQDGVLFDKEKERLLRYPSGNGRTSYQIPDSVTTIWDSAFGGSRSLTSVVIPNSVTIIMSSAFHSCRNLASVAIPDSVKTIERRAFGYQWYEGYNPIKIKSFKIYGHSKGSEAEKYAKNNGFTYAIVGS